MDKQQLAAIAKEFGTPSFVFDTAALTARMREIKAIVGDSVHLCYSIKANPFLIPAMRELVETLEVCSPGELEICEALHVDPETILFSGVNKTAEDIEHAMDAGVVRFTAESPLHIRLLNEAALRRGRVYPVLLRLTAGSQFGMDESDLLDAIAHRSDYAGLRFTGIHYFSGTQRAKLDKDQRKELAMLGEFMDRLKQDYGFVCGQLTARRPEIRAGALLMPCDIGRLPQIGREDAEAGQTIREVLDDSAGWLNGTSGEALWREAEENSRSFALESAAEALAKKPLLCVSGSLDIYTPPAYHCEPLARAIRARDGGLLRCVTYPTDHFFADYRLTVADTVAEFLLNQL